jgi:2-polyprenyl-3-methyl-5-hydroxy-6-metoxy-1,4-benzoquinol methylase
MVENAAGAPNPTTVDSRQFWNQWNTTFRAGLVGGWKPDETAQRRHEAVLAEAAALGLNNPAILEVGCGGGWLSEHLRAFGSVTAVDIADQVVAQAQARFPHVKFIAGDFYTMDLPANHFDVVVSEDSISCVPDQPSFMRRMAERLKPGGYLVLATQNRFVWEMREDINPKAFAPIRKWLNRKELKALIAPWFDVVRLTTVAPGGHAGVLRIVNSYKLEAVLTRFMSPNRTRAIRERLGFGQSFVLVARRRT